jgi:hypothetical protein
MVTITFTDRATERRALGFLLGRYSGRVMKSGEHLVPEAALKGLAARDIPFTVKDKTSPHRTLSEKWIIAAVAVVGLLLLLLLLLRLLDANYPVTIIREGGHWPISVTIVSTSGSRIASASCEVGPSDEWGRYVLEHLAPPESPMHSVVEDPFLGQPLCVTVPTGAKTEESLLRSKTTHSQYRHLVVIVRYADGRREGRLCEIPDLRKARSVRVEFP